MRLFRLLLGLSLTLSIFSCRDTTAKVETDAPETKSSEPVAEQGAPETKPVTPEKSLEEEYADLTSSDSEIVMLKNKIQNSQQTVQDLQAAVDMERAKLEDNPDYDQSFLLDVLDEQQAIQQDIDANLMRLRELSPQTREGD